MEIFVIFLVRVYLPQFISIKQLPNLQHGSYHFYKAIERSRDAFEGRSGVLATSNRKLGLKWDRIPLFDIVKEVYRVNNFHALFENILFCMVFDQNLEVRAKALEIIEYIRKNKKEQNNTIRKLDHHSTLPIMIKRKVIMRIIVSTQS